MKIDDKIVGYEISKQVSRSHARPPEELEEALDLNKEAQGQTDSGDPDAIVNLSQTSREVQLLKEAVSAQPDLRAEKVAALKEAIESGRYEIDYQKVADKLVDTLLEEV